MEQHPARVKAAARQERKDLLFAPCAVRMRLDKVYCVACVPVNPIQGCAALCRTAIDPVRVRSLECTRQRLGPVSKSMARETDEWASLETCPHSEALIQDQHG